MADTVTKGEMHGCIVCGKLYNLYVVYDKDGNFIGSRVMSAGGHEVKGAGRPLVACDIHSDADVARAVEMVYGQQSKDDDY
ncbi:MAG: hypothetical protein ACM3XO_00800 [Bacteroidota bacterium]